MIGVGFDIDHTLAIDNKLERVAFLQMLQAMLARGGRVGSLDEETQRIDALLVQQRSGAFSIEDAVRRFTAERGVEAREEDVAWFRDTVLAMVEHFVVPDPQAPAMLRELARRGIRVAVLSNGWNPLQQAKALRAGFSGTVIASGDLGTQKPKAAAFEALTRELGVDPRDTYYVGDDPAADIAGALQAGMNAIWLDNEGKTYPSSAPPPTMRVSSLEEVLAVVGG